MRIRTPQTDKTPPLCLATCRPDKGQILYEPLCLVVLLLSRVAAVQEVASKWCEPPRHMPVSARQEEVG